MKPYEEVCFPSGILRWIREGDEYVCRLTEDQMHQIKQLHETPYTKTYSGGKPNYTQPIEREPYPENFIDALRFDAAQSEPVIQARKEGDLIVVDLPQVPTGGGGISKDEQPEPEPEKSQDKPCVEDDGCPTEKAVLQRFWREHQAQPEQEPVAWISHNAGLYHGKPDESLNPLPLYTAPPKKEWVGLTKEELAEIAEFHFHGAFSGRDFYDDVEAKLKEKNT